MLHQTPSDIVCPRGKPGQNPLVIDLAQAAKIEARTSEVAFVTPAKAPELLAVFSRACLDVKRQLALIELELQAGIREADRIRAVVLLDKCPGILQAKGLIRPSQPAGSEDLRNAVLATDTEYQDQLQVVDEIRCIIELVQGQYDSFERAYTSVKKIMGESAYSYKMPNSSLSGSGDDRAAVGSEPRQSVEESPSPVVRRQIPGFGKAKF